jgi:glutamyl-tRNA reductase
MHILCLGINHTTASLDIREKLAFSEDGIHSALARLGCNLPDVTEMVIISTCNRTEVYALSGKPAFDELEAFLAELHGLSAEDFRGNLFRYADEGVVNHLYHVTTGLDSLVIGEPQILGQVKRSLELALGVGTCGAVLSRLFRSAIRVGKRARTETAICRHPASVSSLAASLVANEVKNLPAAQVLVVGAGEMAELAVEALRKRGVTQIVVLNRTLERAQQLAKRWQAQATNFEDFENFLLHADVVISSTSAPRAIISAPFMEKIMLKRSQRLLVLVDIAVPRDIDPEVSLIPGIKLFDIDSLDRQVNSLLAERAIEVPLVEAIVAEEETRFLEYLKALDMLPIITELRQQAERIRQNELEKTLRHLPELTKAECDRIDAMTQALVKKLLEAPTLRLRMESSGPHASEYATVAQTLFDLPVEHEVCALSKQVCSLSESGTKTTVP